LKGNSSAPFEDLLGHVAVDVHLGYSQIDSQVLPDFVADVVHAVLVDVDIHRAIRFSGSSHELNTSYLHKPGNLFPHIRFLGDYLSDIKQILHNVILLNVVATLCINQL